MEPLESDNEMDFDAGPSTRYSRGRRGAPRSTRGRGRGRRSTVRGASTAPIGELPQSPDRGSSRGGRSRSRSRTRQRVTRPSRGRSARSSSGRRASKTRLDNVDIERVSRLQRERADNIEQSIGMLDADQMRDILALALREHPGLLFDVWGKVFAATPPGDGAPPPSPSGNSPQWCVCDHCQEMETDAERLCCGMHPDHCISTTAAFELVGLDPHVLQVANWYRHDLLAADVGYDHRAKRHSAYRQYILWQHGRLGPGVRRVIPSCVVWRVRNQYPSPIGQYTGFVPYRLG